MLINSKTNSLQKKSQVSYYKFIYNIEPLEYLNNFE